MHDKLTTPNSLVAAQPHAPTPDPIARDAADEPLSEPRPNDIGPALANAPMIAEVADELAAKADEALGAIDALEALLETRHGMPSEPASVASTPIEHEGQYTIPLLNEVVLPGHRAALEESPPPELSPMARRLFDRLASEIDVIVQTGVDDALKAAARDIRQRVKDHVAIVLPEILDELSHDDSDENIF